MSNISLLYLISDLVRGEIDITSEKESFVRRVVYDESSNTRYELRYFEGKEPSRIRIEKVPETNAISKEIAFREFLWNFLGLDRIQEIYRKQYEEWKKWNNNIDYIPVSMIGNNAPEEKPQKSDRFFSSFCVLGESSERGNGLSLVMADYGMGKSSFCINLCKTAADDAEHIRKLFFDGEISFPLLFSLNTYKNGDFDEFIENRLYRVYDIHISFSLLVDLCCAGYFSIVLDAWDQMHHTPYVSQVMHSLNSIYKLCNPKGRVLITCRRTFYQKYLKEKNNSIQEVQSSIIQTATLFTLGGFSKGAALKYLKEALGQSLFAGEISENWMTDSWTLNSDFLEKPFNIKLLASNFETVTESLRLPEKHVSTYDFLKVILNKWRKENGISSVKSGDYDPLKELVFQTLSMGLNRGIDVEQYKRSLVDKKRAEKFISALRRLEFIEIKEEGQACLIEFRLATFQEFLWAYYVLEELNERCLLNNKALINVYMLQLEVRAWICEELKKRVHKKSDLLKIQLKGDGKGFLGLKYKDKAEIGYCASNVLTLYRDLSKDNYYYEQFLELKGDLRHYCFEEADLRGLNLKGAQFDYSDLARADLSYTELENASFRAADLSEVIWDEFGRILKCAFIESFSSDTKTGDVLSIAVGTESGSVLTYSISTEDVNIMYLENSKINAIVADSIGIYTASQDGWVGYVDAKSGELKNAYISTNGLQSITTVGRATIYIGAEANGLFRYNWKTGVKHAIEIDGDVSDILAVNYYKIGEENYIACISGYNKKELLLLKLVGRTRARIAAQGRLKEVGSYFDDICFAGRELVYAVSDKGVYSLAVDDLLDMYELDDKDLCNEDNCRFSYRGKAELAWAEEARMLFVLEKIGDKLKTITGIHWDEEYRNERIDLEWNYKDTNYTMAANNVGFSVSANANYLAIYGDRLAVFELEEDYYQLIKEPVEARINVNGADFRFCNALSSDQAKEFEKRGASVSA